MILPCSVKKNQISKIKSKIKNIVNFYISQFPNFSSQKQGGFTFIELLVAAGLIGVIVAAGVASYNSFNEKRIVRNEAEKIKINLRLAQTKALAGGKDCSVCCTVCPPNPNPDCNVPLTGWYARFPSLASPNARMQIYGQCGSNTFPSPAQDIDLNDSVTLSLTNFPPVPGDRMLFKPMRQGTDLSNNAQIVVSGFGYTEPIRISILGEIK